MNKFTDLEKKWILYDGGNSAFTLLASTIIPIYFNLISESAGVLPHDYLAYWGYAASISTAIVAVLGPVLGIFSDAEGRKKRVFIAVLAVGLVFFAALGLANSYLIFIAMYIIARCAYQLSLVIYDSMLVDVSKPENMDRVSSHGYAWGYILSCIPFAASIAIVMFGDNTGLSKSAGLKLTFVINALWWLLLSLPIVFSYKQLNCRQSGQTAENPFSELGKTFMKIKDDKKVMYFLAAFFFYIDGVYTIIDMAVAYGSSLGLDSVKLLLALLLTQVVAFPSAIIIGKLASKFKAQLLLKICIAAYFFITLFATGLDSIWKFWVLAVAVGLFQGGIQALSRSYYSRIIPSERSGEYFGIYDICGKGAAFLGTFLMSLISQITKNQSLGILVLPVMLAVGMVFFIKAEREV